MKSRNSRANSGYVGQNRLSDDYGVISENKNYLRSNLTQWIRPANWLPLPSMTAGDQMFAGLLAVYPGDPALTGPTASGNFVAFSVTGCTYTVDWGNGTTQSYSAGVTAQYNFDFGSISAATSVTGVEGLSGYRQTVIKAYPTVAGTTFSGIDLAGKYSQAGYTFGSAWSPAWLDMRIAGSTISSFKFFIPNSGVSNNIEQFEWVGNSGITNGTSFFSSNSSGIAGCKNLKSLIGTSWTSNIINFTSMFSACKILRTIPLLNTASGTNFTSMFQSCTSLETIPLLNTASGTNFTSMFQSSNVLRTVPLLNTASGTNFTSMFANCSSLQTVPLLNTASGTIFTGMFNSCRNLQTIPPLNLTSGTDFSTMFASCESLQTIPLLNTASGINFIAMFSGCSNLQTIPLLNTAKGTSISSMFRFCHSLQTIPLLDFRAAQLFNLVFDGCNNLKQAATQIPAINSPWSVSGNNLSPAAINQIFTKLPTGAAFVRTCEITNNWGAAGCDKSIATAKGWNVK
jgi:hypothetical protein